MVKLSYLAVVYWLKFILIALSDNNNNNYIFVEEPVDWIEANRICITKYDSKLATISNLQQNNEALSLCQSTSCWIGLSNIFGAYDYMEQTGMIFSNFCGFDSYDHSSSILNCISIQSETNDSCWDYNDCQQTKLPFLCNAPLSSKSKCNYFIDESHSLLPLPSPIDICYGTSNGMNNVYKCDNDGVDLYSIPQTLSDGECVTTIDHKLDSYRYQQVVSDMQCTSSVCTHRDIASVVQYNYTNTDDICQDNINQDNSNWKQFDFVMDLCFPSSEYTNLYAKLTCSDQEISQFFYNDSKCDQFLFGSTLYKHNKCSIDGLFGYEIKHCGMDMEMAMAALLNIDSSFGYINDGKLSIPMNECQTIYIYPMSYQYICNDQIITKRVWWNNTDCNDFNYFDTVISLDDVVDFNCNYNDNIDVDIVNIEYYHDLNESNPVFVYEKNVIINECFAINWTFSFQYQCDNNSILYQLIYSNSTNCSGDVNVREFGVNDEYELIPLYDCNQSIVIIPEDPISTFVKYEKAKIFILVVLALIVACCLMFVIFGVLVWNYIKTQKAKKEADNARRCRSSFESAQIEMEIECTPTIEHCKSVISYDAEDHGDLPGIELYEARRRSSFESPPVSPFTTTKSTLPPLPTKAPLLTAASSDCTIITNTTVTIGCATSNCSQFMPMLMNESERVFSGEYYEPTEATDDSETML